MFSFPIPVVGIGPGSQPDEGLPLNTLDLPSEMHIFRPPVIDSEADPETYRAALDVLRHVLAGLETLTGESAHAFRMSMLDLDPAVLKEANEMLGQGEVSVLAEGLTAQETMFTGIWRIRSEGVDDLEASPFPTALRQLAAARRVPAESVDAPPANLMNAPALLAEIRDVSARCRPGDAAHVINLSLLPVTPEDTDYLDTMLGRGGLSVLSRGFGNCRITATAYPNVWWVQYFNSMEKLILNSVEVVDVPAVALAAAEDFADSRVRLVEWIESLATAL
ncbi:MAG: hydrogenase expression/formation protein [Gammaproteobacteria bacterium]|nr:hydrogenase expression/formation protein [Gammaproteobacteria bacterium]MBU1416561.1 hydrogenase expression/formation protein [Gammaproteobacteria bacterium]